MIRATSQPAPYLTRFSDGQHEGFSDTTAASGGRHAGFRPHGLLEAALASCIGMTVRMYAERHGIALGGVTVQVDLDRSRPEETVFRFQLEVEGELSPEQKERVMRAAHACPVSRTLAKPIRIEAGPAPGGQVAM